ncbi:DUF362 domain-containing protein [Candidatus Woesearchaeota archaeon]|nr:DUF362 domain-containing protein [Candidatus Woesearchaeota archaeon]
MVSEVFISQEIEKLLEKIDWDVLEGNVGVKVHFGERGCTTYMDPKIVKKVCEAIQARNHKVTLIETNVLYQGSRTIKENHIKVAHEHGFDFCDIDIIDGNAGEEMIEVPVKGEVTLAKLGAGIKRYDSIVVISHFKGHIFAGFGAALKNMGMGFGSRAGKLHMHANVKPSINAKTCVGCQACLSGCDFGAITMNENHAEIDPNKCTGCAMCVAKCTFGAVQIPWGSNSREELCHRIVDYASGVFNIIPKEKFLFINIANKITKLCDCDGSAQTPFMEDLGILYSKNPVALDKACLDLARQKYQKFDSINVTPKDEQIEYAVKTGLFDSEYKLIEL